MKKILILFLFSCFFSFESRTQEFQKCLDPGCTSFLNIVASEHKHVYMSLDPECSDFETYVAKDHKCIKKAQTKEGSSVFGDDKNMTDKKQKTLTTVIKESSFFKAWKILQLSYLAGL